MRTRLMRLVVVVVVVSCCTAYLGAIAQADAPHSSHYIFSESTLGSGGMLQSDSPNYKLTVSVGDTAVGDTSSNGYQVQAGPKTTADPTLIVNIISAQANFGAFSPSAAATATSSFSVIDYTSYGYFVMITGPTPTSGPYVIPGMASTGPSVPGSDQFGINLVANTAPAAFGTNPVQKPDSSFGSGTVDSATCSKITPGYNTPNQFKYVNGDTIAASCKSSGETDYTISYIVNVSALTPGGQYTGGQEIVCVATY